MLAQERNRKLVAERTRLQRELAAAAERANNAERALVEAQQQVARHADLIATLEEDLVKAGCVSDGLAETILCTPSTAQLMPGCWTTLRHASAAQGLLPHQVDLHNAYH